MVLKERVGKLSFGLSYMLVLLVTALLFSCGGGESGDANDAKSTKKGKMDLDKDLPIQPGLWKAYLMLNEHEPIRLPVNFEFAEKDGKYTMTFINGPERILVDDVTMEGDSILSAKFPHYDSEIRVRYNKIRLHGRWHNYAKGKDYVIPFYALYGDSTRFIHNYEEEPINVNGRWATMFFGPGRSSKTDAVAEFVQAEGSDRVTGTFQTPTGDYRFLEGNAGNGKLSLSCFDGSHAFMFTAQIDEYKDLEGHFYSGNHWHETWTAYRDDTVSMPDPTTLTAWDKGISPSFKGFDLKDGQVVTEKDERFKDKVVLLQIMGTWCPNCRDETEFFVDLHKKYHKDGLEIVALAFESADEFQEAKPVMDKYAAHFDIPYTMLYGGEADKKLASKALPFLDKVTAYPTSVIIGYDGKVKHVHTGYNGPATKEYEAQNKQFEDWVAAELKP